MRSLPKLLLVLPLLPSPALAEKIDCQKDLKEARELIEARWSFKLFKPGAFDLDWEYRRLESQAKRAETPEECADVLSQFMARLNDGHSRLQSYPGLHSTAPRMIVRSQRERLSSIVGQKPAIHVYVYARDTTDASVKGIPVGSEILEVDGVSIAKVYERLETRESGSTDQWREHRCDRRLLFGRPETEVTLKYRLPGGAQRTATVMRPSVEDQKNWAEENSENLNFTSWKYLDSGWGYIKYGSFAFGSLEYTVQAFDEAADSLIDAPGLIIDLRGNSGGYVDATTEIAGRFINDKATFGYYQIRQPGQEVLAELWDPTTGSMTGRPRLLAEPRKNTYEGPVVILIDRACFSACETFTAGMQDLGRALVVGPSASGGGSGFVGGLELPSGAVISFSWTVAWRPDGQQIETNGVAPDIRVRERPRDWTIGRDRVLERAVKALEGGAAPTIAAVKLET